MIESKNPAIDSCARTLDDSVTASVSGQNCSYASMDRSFEEIVADLQSDLAFVDLSTRPSSGMFELLILKRDNLKVKIYQEQRHSLPHVHVDYGKYHHAASYSIDPPARIEGQLHHKYDAPITQWILGNKDDLLKLWSALQAGDQVTDLVASLAADA